MTASLKLFYPSGLNDRFPDEKNLAFMDYVQKTRDIITQARIDITPSTVVKIVDANAAFEWRSTEKSKRGLLLVHGLYDSPFMLRDIGDHFSTQGFLVRSILLPGHGTVPGDLLNVHYTEWLKAVDYGVESLAGEAEHIFIVGFSLGGALTLNKALRDARVRGIILISPALALKNQWLTGQLIRWQRWIAWALPNAEWYKKRTFQYDYTKYESFCCNAAQQIYQVILETQKLLQKNTLSIPVFLTVSAEDEVICSQTCLNFFASHHHSLSRLLWYAHQSQTIQDTRVSIKNSAFTEQKILDFSHICLPISPNNSHYGKQGDYQDFLQYPNNQAPLHQEIFLGAVSKANLKKHVIQRLSYNPDFLGMVKMMEGFLGSIC